jgi:hypothetical protein
MTQPNCIIEDPSSAQTFPPSAYSRVADLRAALPAIKTTVRGILPALSVFCKKCGELHPSYLASSREYPTALAGDVTTWESLAQRNPLASGYFPLILAPREVRRKYRVNGVHRLKLAQPLVEIQVPELKIVHESFGAGLPFEVGNEADSLWVHFSDGDRLVKTSGFLENDNPILELFRNQIVQKPRTFKQFCRQKRKILVTKIESDSSLRPRIESAAANRSLESSQILVQLLNQYSHLSDWAILPWTLLPIAGEIPDIVKCPTASAVTGSRPSQTIHSDLLFSQYYKGRSAQFVTAKDMAENTYRFTDVQARRNAAMGSDPTFMDSFDMSSLEFMDGARGISDLDSTTNPVEDEIQTIQSNWFSSLGSAQEAIASVRQARQELEYKQALLKYRRELTIARASLQQVRWEPRYEACRQRCNCSSPKCECLRLPCECFGRRCRCWKTVQKCNHQFMKSRPFSICPQQWIADPNGDEFRTRSVREIEQITGFSRQQIRKTNRDIDAMVAANNLLWLRKEHGRPLPGANREYYMTSLARSTAFYKYTEESVGAWAEAIKRVPSGLTAEQEMVEYFQEWRLIHSPLLTVQASD